jgi:pilus assembly protein Flp/PilA
MLSFARRLLRDERGATAVEYALTVALIALVCIEAETRLGAHLRKSMSTAAKAVRLR